MADRTTCRWSWPGAPSPSSPVVTASALSSVVGVTRSLTAGTSRTRLTVGYSNWRMATTEMSPRSQWIQTCLIIIYQPTKFTYSYCWIKILFFLSRAKIQDEIFSNTLIPIKLFGCWKSGWLLWVKIYLNLRWTKSKSTYQQTWRQS